MSHETQNEKESLQKNSFGNVKASGKVISALGNLVKVEFEGEIVQGEIGFIQLENAALKAEVIEIDGSVAKVQVFEDTRGIKYHTPVYFTEELLEVELGPGLLGEIFDGLQTPLEDMADVSGLYLARGIQISPLDRGKRWEFTPLVKIGQVVERGDSLGTVPEAHFTHHIMVNFKLYGKLEVTMIKPSGNYTLDNVIARVKDEKGVEHDIFLYQKWPVKFPLREGIKIKNTKPLVTGMRVIDTLIPIAMGGTACNPGPFGAGKTVTQQSISKHSNVEIVVITACGERAGEVVETIKTYPHLIDVHTNRPLMERTIIICNTSSMPVAAREASVYVGITIAEYYRMMGLNVLVLADSTSRWAQAMREMSGRLEEIPGDEAFPSYLPSRIASFYERAGTIRTKNGKTGSVTILGAVSPAGGNFNEPVTQSTMNVVGAFICLSREFSDKRKYPAINPSESWSKYVDLFAHAIRDQAPFWSTWVKKAHEIIEAGNEIGRRMEVVGQEGISIRDMVTYLKAELFSFCYLQQNAFDKEDAYSSLEQQILYFDLMNQIFDREYAFSSQDEARSYFLFLQGKIKNLNHLPFKSDSYNELFKEVQGEVQNSQVLK